ncbi:MAG: formylmethanofuran--tetrahydromethanopterin N-formyltransferase [Candidatus Methylomirabilis oxygeniifera]|uniref:Formylmethanofuran--tetrahydromethanopterin formyltransferase n=1 Tax=Methylomirabilis oxygeniifera TaxID=671143 RepID=D5MJV3_METO1|nr:MAG: formylmethanofuran--tetrahydromethanopterin N-formyltransferase [Candidatus Methylomirabilis oxyfera]CBE67536.1 Formyltransferase/hydrolase complex subunit epsilon (fhcD) [Candidatus Methylomirabilis oxyfera]
MEINGVHIDETYAEAFGAYAGRVTITACSKTWAYEAARSMTGFGTSVIGCGCEVAIEGIEPTDTPDDRPGVSVLLFAMSKKAVQEQLINRIGQCVMTAPTSACYNALEAEDRLSIGGKLKFFGDGFQISKRLDSQITENGSGPRRFWRIPVMDGEFIVEDRFGVKKGVAGGNFLLLGRGLPETLQAAERAIEVMRKVSGVIMPFPGGVVRSGSKVGSRYKFLNASSNTAFCPSLRGSVKSDLPEGVGAVLEIVIDGLTPEAVGEAMRVGIRAACGPGIVKISAGNYGGKLGKHHFHLHQLLAEG